MLTSGDPLFFSLPIRHDIAGSGNEFEKGSQETLFPADRTPEEVFLCFRYGVTEKVMDVAESQAGHKKMRMKWKKKDENKGREEE